MRKLLIALAVIIVLTPVALYLVREPLIKMAINNIGTAVVKTDVSVENVSFKPFSGFMAIYGFKVANPEGFSNNNAIQIQEVRVRLSPKSLLSGPIQIQEVSVEEPEIRLEGGLKNNNLTALKDNLPGGPATPAADEKSEADKPAESRPVEVDLLSIADGRVVITKPLATTAKLGSITIRDIGKAGGVTTVADVVTLIMNRILSVGGQVITQEITNHLAQKGSEALQDVGNDVEREAKGALDKLGDKVKGLFGN